MSPRVAIVISCLIDQQFPKVGVAVAAVLKKLGCAVTIPPGQTCCGLPMLHAGLPTQAKALARRTIEIFESAEYVVTPSPACGAMIRERYADLLGDDPAYEASMWAVAGKTYEFTEFLRDVVRVDLSGLSLPTRSTVTYHPSCQLRALRMVDSTPTMLKQFAGVTYRALPGAEKCCGFGGPFSRDFPEISRAMGDQKAAAIAETNSDFTVCNEPGCTQHLQRTAGEFKHIAELIAEAMG